MLKNLIKIAADLDAAGFRKEADIVDLIIRKVSSQSTDTPFEEEPDSGLVSSSSMSQEEWNKLLDRMAEEEGDESPGEGDIEDYLFRGQ